MGHAGAGESGVTASSPSRCRRHTGRVWPSGGCRGAAAGAATWGEQFSPPELGPGSRGGGRLQGGGTTEIVERAPVVSWGSQCARKEEGDGAAVDTGSWREGHRGCSVAASEEEGLTDSGWCRLTTSEGALPGVPGSRQHCSDPLHVSVTQEVWKIPCWGLF